jgi:8-oxo-dGTP pyrophosphatase MutT (NUDIX family)
LANILFKNPFLTVQEREGYIFAHEARTNGRTVSLLPFRDTSNGREYLARIEVCPAHSMEPGQYSITGGVQKDETILSSAQRELREESGYAMRQDEFIGLGQVFPTKQMDTTVYLFAIDVTGKPQEDALDDSGRREQNSGVEWVDLEAGLKNQDPLFITAIARLQGMK